MPVAKKMSPVLAWAEKAQVLRNAAEKAVVARLGKTKVPGLRALRVSLAFHAVSHVHNGTPLANYQQWAQNSVELARSGVRDGVLYERERLALSDDQVKKEVDLVRTSAEVEYERIRATTLEAEEAPAPALTPTKGGGRIGGADVFAKASPILQELEFVSPGAMTRSRSLEIKGKRETTTAMLAPAPSSPAGGGARSASRGRSVESTATGPRTKKGAAAATPPKAASKGKLPAPAARAPPKGGGAATAAPAPPAKPTATASRPAKSNAAQTPPTFVLRLKVHPTTTFKDGRDVQEITVTRGETVVGLRQKMKTLVNRDWLRDRLLAPRGIGHFSLTTTRNGRVEVLRNGTKLEHGGDYKFVVGGAAPRKTPLKKRGDEKEEEEEDDGDEADDGIGGDAPAAGAIAAVGPLLGPAPPAPPMRIPEKEAKKVLVAAMERMVTWIGVVATRTGRYRKEGESPLELAQILTSIESTIPPREKKPLSDADYGKEDTTDINGVFDEARIADVFRGGADSIHRGLGSTYVKADDPNVLQKMLIAALEARKPERALDLARNGVRPKPTALTDERISKFLPSRDATRDESPETQIPTLPEEMCESEDLVITMETMMTYLAQKSVATARGCNGPMWKQLKDLVSDEAGATLLHSIVQVLAQEKVQMKFTADEEALLKQGAGISIDKDDGGLRPIGILNTLLSLSHAVMQRTLMEKNLIMPLVTPNLGLGVKGAADLMPRVFTDVLRDDVEKIAASMDVETAFPSVHHDTMLNATIAAAKDKPELYVLVRHAFNMYTGVPFKLNFTCPITGAEIVSTVSRGTIQGSITGVLLFIIAVNYLLKDVRAEFPPSSLTIEAISDDHSALGKVATVLAALPKIKAALAKGGLNLKDTKTHFSGTPLADPAVRAQITAATGYAFPADYARERDDVQKLAGIPVGHPTPVKLALSRKIDNLIKSVRVLLEAAMSPNKKDRYAIMQTIYLLRACIIPAATHFTRGMEPAVSKPEVSRLDAEIVRAIFCVVRLEPLLKGTPENGALAGFLANPQRNDTGGFVGMETIEPSVIKSIIRIFLPSNLGGLGMQPLALLADANYLASIQLTAHALPPLCPDLVHFVGIDGLALPAQPEGPADPAQRDNVVRIPQFKPEVMQAAEQARKSITALFEGEDASADYRKTWAPPSVKAELRNLYELNVFDVPSNAKRGTTSAMSRVVQHSAYLHLYQGLSEEERIAIKSSSGSAAGAWQRARPLHKNGVLSNGITDSDYAWTIKYALGMPFALDATDPGKSEALLPCVACGRAMSMEHALSCTTKKDGVKVHNANVAVIAKVAKQAYHEEPVRVAMEQPVEASYPTAKPNYADPSRPLYQDLRSDVGVYEHDGSGARITVDMKVNAPAAYKFRPTGPTYSAPAASEAEVKALLEANSGLAPVPTSARLQNWLPGTGPYVEHKITTSGFVGEAEKVSLYGKRSEGFKGEDFYAVVIDTHGAINPRGRDLVRKLSKKAAETATARRAAVRPWWEIAEAVTIELSATTQRGVATRLNNAYTRGKREALAHSNPAGALGAPKTKFSTIKHTTEKRSLVPGHTWKSRAIPLKPVTKRGPTAKTRAKTATRTAAAANAGPLPPHVG